MSSSTGFSHLVHISFFQNYNIYSIYKIMVMYSHIFCIPHTILHIIIDIFELMWRFLFKHAIHSEQVIVHYLICCSFFTYLVQTSWINFWTQTFLNKLNWFYKIYFSCVYATIHKLNWSFMSRTTKGVVTIMVKESNYSRVMY